MVTNHLISICIPAYKQPAYLERCLQSITMQNHKQIEVIITDDTPDETVKIIAEKFKAEMNIFYQKNKQALGSPANWNEALKQAKGQFVLLLHHDDMLAGESSLQSFIAPFIRDETIDFVFGRNSTIDDMQKGPFDWKFFNRYYRNPDLLIAGQTIGPPSNVMLKRTALEFYDERYKWIVDIEYYCRLFRSKKKFYYVDEHLIRVGIHEGQVTNTVINDRAILIYENTSFAVDYLQKVGNIKVFDFYWRLMRNNNVRCINDITTTGIKESQLPRFIKHIVNTQKKFSPKALKQGIISKSLMLATYLRA